MYFHVDTKGTLETGMVIKTSPSTHSIFGNFYHKKFEQFGIEPILDLHKVPTIVNVLEYPFYREFYLEVFRLGHPELIGLENFSRLSSFFAVETLEEARKYIERSGHGNTSKIFEVFSDGPVMKLDMTWLDQEFPKDIRQVGYYYLHYWLGNKIEEDVHLKEHEKRGSLMEVLIASDVTIGTIVQQ